MKRYAGLAGIGAGVALVGEFGLFMASGFTPAAFADAETALPFLSESGTILRAAVLFGIAGVVLRTLFLVGLADELQPHAPTRAAMTLYLGVLGGAGHGLVALTFWLGIPQLAALGSGAAGASGAWNAFTLFTSGLEGFGNLLLGLSVLAAGWALISTRVLSLSLGWLGVAAGMAAILRVLSAGTPIEMLGMAVFLPSLVLAAAFLVWGGVALRANGTPVTRRAPVGQTA